MATTASPAKPAPPRPRARRAKKPPLDVPQLLKMSQGELDALFSASAPGPTPTGVASGTVIAAAGTPAAGPLASVLGLAWRGKVFYPAEHDLLNRVLPLGVQLVRAKVYREESWFDGQEAIILDYSKTSLLAHSIRDEIRRVAPGLYLGIVYVYRL